MEQTLTLFALSSWVSVAGTGLAHLYGQAVFGMKMRPICIALLLFASLHASAATAAPHRRPAKRHHSDLKRQAAWAGAGAAAGKALGPAGSATVDVVHYRDDLKAGGRKRNRALIKIGAPIAAAAALGPVGVMGYEGVEHRKWIVDHLVPGHHDRPAPPRAANAVPPARTLQPRPAAPSIAAP
jgi:hypothetical protein